MKSNLFKITALVFLSVLLGSSIGFAATFDHENTKTIVIGKVKCLNQGLSGVVVTDGNHFTVTDKEGNYSLPTSLNATHVYISSPSGYCVPVVNSVPQFYIKLANVKDKNHLDFHLNKIDVSDQKHYFMVIGDPQVRNEKEILQLNPILDFLKKDIKINNLNPVHLMVVGDVVFNTPDMHDQSKKAFSAVDQPVYYCIGNHDHVVRKSQPASDDYNKMADQDFISHYGPTYYSFNRGQAHYISLDNIFYRGGPQTEFNYFITKEQLDWIKKDLSYVSKDKVLIIMAHSPFKHRDGSAFGKSNNNELYPLLAGYKDVQFVTGHTHTNYVVMDKSGMTEHVVGAACGGWWEGPVCTDGTSVGYKIFEVDGTNIKWKLRSCQYPDKQFTIIKPGPRPDILRPSDELIVNVWDWDITWKVTWSEDNGATFKEMPRLLEKAIDPIAYQYYGVKGDSIPVGRKFIGASASDHLFSCAPATSTKKVIVKVVNHFNEEFTDVVDL